MKMRRKIRWQISWRIMANIDEEKYTEAGK